LVRISETAAGPAWQVTQFCRYARSCGITGGLLSGEIGGSFGHTVVAQVAEAAACGRPPPTPWQR
jgi:hypothetical protein